MNEGTSWAMFAGPLATVYLAGPMDGCTEGEAKDWRQDAKKLLPNCSCIDPTDYFLGDVYMPRSKEIVAINKRDIRASDILLAHIWKKGFGTAMELIFSHEIEEMPVVVAWPESMGRVSPWVVEHATVILPTVPDACGWIENLVTRRTP